MAKRFIDTKIWDKSWFRNLKSRQKLLWFYLMTKCDHAGILDADFVAASFFIGEEVTEIDIEWMKGRLIPLTSNNGQQQYFIPSFIDYQYGYLKETSKPHLSVRKRLIDKGLEKFINKGLKNISKGCITLKDKDKDKDKEKDKDKVRGRAEKFALDAIGIGKELKIKENHVIDFVDYWIELNRGGTKFKAEMQQTFDIKRRLRNWVKNDKKWGKNEAREKMSISSG